MISTIYETKVTTLGDAITCISLYGNWSKATDEMTNPDDYHFASYASLSKNRFRKWAFIFHITVSVLVDSKNRSYRCADICHSFRASSVVQFSTRVKDVRLVNDAL